jgi:hypothetical protein
MNLFSVLLALAVQARTPPPKVSLSTNDSHRFEADLEGEGDVAVSQLKLSVDVTAFAAPTDFLRFVGGFDRYEYDFSDNAELVRGLHDTFDAANVLRAEATYFHVFDAAWTGLAYGSVYCMFEPGASIADSASYGLGIGVMHRSGPDLTLGVMLRVQTLQDDGPYVFPVPVVDWAITPRLRLQNEERLGFGYGLAWQVEEGSSWSLETRMYYQGRRIRLDEGSFVDEGIVQDERFAWDAGIRLQSGPVKAGIHLGLDLWQEYSVEAKNGNDIERVQTDPAPYLALSFTWTF